MSTDRASDAAILHSLAAMMRGVVIPLFEGGAAAADAHARSSVVQLTGLVEYAASRAADPAACRRDELSAALAGLADNPIIASRWPGEPFAVAAEALTECVGRGDTAADEVRSVLRRLLVAQLDDELLSTAPLLDAYRGRLRDG